MPGMRIGLFGGSFNPPHEGHRLVALQCLKRLQLDAIWILVTPGNPLKDHSQLAPLADRIAAVRALMDHPRIAVTGFEAAHSSATPTERVSFLRSSCDGVKFVWIMGGDSLRDFHGWERWEQIAQTVPIAVYARPGANFQGDLVTCGDRPAFVAYPRGSGRDARRPAAACLGLPARRHVDAVLHGNPRYPTGHNVMQLFARASGRAIVAPQSTGGWSFMTRISRLLPHPSPDRRAAAGPCRKRGGQVGGQHPHRAPSSSKSRVVGTLKAGDELTVTCSNRGWCELADGHGFVAKSFLRLDQEVAVRLPR